MSTVALCAGLVAAPRVEFPRNQGACNAYGALHDDADIRDVGDFRLLTAQPARLRDPCEGDDLWHYNLPADVDGVLFEDCVISWVSGWRADATWVGIPCVPVAPTPVSLTATAQDLSD